MSRVVVIGGGVIGVSCAYYLSRAGCDVTLIDRGRIGGACSHGNCGLVCPSHVLPLAGPGAIRAALASMLRKNPPFHIKPRLDPQLWSWLFRFARRCNRSDMLAAGRACQALLGSSLAMYRELLRDEPIDCEWETRGLLFVYETAKEFDAFQAVNELLSEHFQLAARRIRAGDLNAFEPAIRPGLAGGYYYEHDSHLRPDKLLAGWRRVLEARGVKVIGNCELLRFDSVGNGPSLPAAAGAVPAGESKSQHHTADPERHRGRSLQIGDRRATRVITSCGELEADAFVVATGAWTPRLAKSLGCRVPIQPGKGYSLTMPRPAVCPRVPLILSERHVAVTPMKSAYRLGSTMEFAGYDTSLRPGRLELLRQGAAACLREPYCEPVEESWYGWRPMTYDSVPFIGRSPRWDNLFIAAGHNMLGLSMAPATGKLIAELLSEATPHIDPTPYSVSRFI
jgi:D-amino-acid dehydrogenase